MLLVAAAAPALIRVVLRRRRLAAARAGDPVAAWRAVQEDAVDLGIPAPGAESPRAFAARLVDERGAAADDVDLLREALERASYAGDTVDPAGGPALVAAAEGVRASLAARAGAGRRARALLLPRALIVRPGAVPTTPDRETVG